LFDRIQAPEHWKSEADKEQAIRIASLYFDEIDWSYLEKNAGKKNHLKCLKL